uniref:cytochrome c oxidase subunit 2 n=1 Tax=Pallenopsis patagonica TaxID=648475 RepID=UPI00226D104F|nr:cytochrome c oxidase subunit 2 [Pallenopsis patagonica]UZA61340.1 cytochrome c oxidase subunit 2 [Pallenopsis patagonica]
MPTWNHINFQDSSSPTMEQLIFFHDHTMMILVMITMFIIYMMITSMFNKNINKMLLESQLIESIWTLIPMIILTVITIPSLRILYLMEEINNPMLTIKSIGHQWYWSYEYSDFNNIEFDSFMLPNSDSIMRLLEVDNRMMIPMNMSIRMLTTSADVIHSWTIPTMSIKMDSLPGRINQSILNSTRPGIFMGQCSEICGANHSFMPIVMESINMKSFINWITNL